jgi:hypothetical protein
MLNDVLFNRHRTGEADRKEGSDGKHHGCQGELARRAEFLVRRLMPNMTQTVADVIRTCLGPKAMLKMILDPMGGIL